MAEESRGILYIAAGRDAVDDAIDSAASVHTAMPEMSTAIVTDVQPVDSDLFDDVIEVEEPMYGEHPFEIVPQFVLESPYDRTLYLDNDTYVDSDISEVFDLLDRFDVAAAHAPYRRLEYNPNEHEEVTIGTIPISMSEFNCGVIAYRDTPSTTRCFEDWYERYDSSDVNNDQPFFLRAIYESDVDVATLPPAYNCRVVFNGWVEQQVKILHGDCENPEEVVEKLNRRPTESRLFEPHLFDDYIDMKITYLYSDYSLLGRLRWMSRSALFGVRKEGLGVVPKLLKKVLRLVPPER